MQRELPLDLADDVFGRAVGGFPGGQALDIAPKTERLRAPLATRIQVPLQASPLLRPPLLAGEVHAIFLGEMTTCRPC